MRKAIDLIKGSLKGIYPAGEIEGFIRLIFEDLCGYTTTQLLLNRDNTLSPEKSERVTEIVERLVRKEPIQYVLGHTEFCGMRMEVGSGVLIPRPETQEMVRRIIADMGKVEGRVADICTGSGCIAIALAAAWQNAEVEGWDISEEALAYARKNALVNDVKIDWSQRDILTYKSDDTPRYRVMVSNPPYVLDSERLDMEENVLDYEPHSALFVPDDNPLLFYEVIGQLAFRELLPGGVLYFEINSRMGQACCKLLQQTGFEDVEVWTDFMGLDRVVKGRKP